MKKTIGLVLLTAGISLTAGYGAVLAPDFRTATAASGEATFADQAVDEAREKYCTLREQFNAGPADGCPGAEELVKETAGLSMAELRAAQFEALTSAERDVQVVQMAHARIEYRLAVKKSMKRWQELEAMGTQGPVPRLSGWFSRAGLGFISGFVLLIMGAWISRRASTAQLDSTASGPAAEVFGVLLGRVRTAVGALQDGMAACAAPTVSDLERFKAELEDIQKGDLARLCASGSRAVARHGVEGMARLFSPLSGAERKLNRAWAAMVDKHWPEAAGSVSGALAELDETAAALETL